MIPPSLLELSNISTERHPSMLLHDALTGYWLDKRSALPPRTARDYELPRSRLLAWVRNERAIESVTADDIRRFLAAMREEHQLATRTVTSATSSVTGAP